MRGSVHETISGGCPNAAVPRWLTSVTGHAGYGNGAYLCQSCTSATITDNAFSFNEGAERAVSMTDACILAAACDVQDLTHHPLHQG